MLQRQHFAIAVVCCVAFIVAYLNSAVNASPAIYLLRKPGDGYRRLYGEEEETRRPVPSKRAFDRLEGSPFDFGMFSKRYNDDQEQPFGIFRDKKSFDRLDSHMFGMLKRKRSFDRLEDGFNFGMKRSIIDTKEARPLTPSEQQETNVPADPSKEEKNPQISIKQLVQQANELPESVISYQN